MFIKMLLKPQHANTNIVENIIFFQIFKIIKNMKLSFQILVCILAMNNM